MRSHRLWAIGVLSGLVLLLVPMTSTMKTFAVRQASSLTLEFEGCRNGMNCGAEFFIGDDVKFSGSLTDQNGEPISGAEIEIVKFIPQPKLVTIATGVTGVDGNYEIIWTADLLRKPS